jgi:hypothetical protein
MDSIYIGKDFSELNEKNDPLSLGKTQGVPKE